ncbi:MAG: hypothetical protein ACOYOV_13290 [Bacteroidales bacterium]
MKTKEKISTKESTSYENKFICYCCNKEFTPTKDELKYYRKHEITKPNLCEEDFQIIYQNEIYSYDDID